LRVLLDTNVLSELNKAEASDRVVEFISQLHPMDTFASVVSIGEIALGIALLPIGRRRREFAEWLLRLETNFGDRLLPCDLEVARIWGESTGRARANGVNIPTSDGLIGATAIRFGLHLVTRNVRHFQPLGALTINPWESNG
jgi:hypothetical protein